MRKTILLLAALVALLLPFAASAQEKGDKKNRDEMRREMEDFKMRFLAQEMELKGDIVGKFQGVFKEQSEEMHRLFQAKRQAEKKLKAIDKPTDKDYEDYQKAISSIKEREAEMEARFDKKYAEFLSAKQIYKMHEAEGKFREKMHQLRARKGHKGRGPCCEGELPEF